MRRGSSGRLVLRSLSELLVNHVASSRPEVDMLLLSQFHSAAGELARLRGERLAHAAGSVSFLLFVALFGVP